MKFKMSEQSLSEFGKTRASGNNSNKLSTRSLLFIVSLAAILTGNSQVTQEISKEKISEIRADFQNAELGKKRITLKPKIEDVDQEHQAAWEYVKKFTYESKDETVRTSALIHSIQPDGDNPHAVITAIQNVSVATMIIIPKDICTEAGWDIILKAKPNPEFAKRWGYKIPDAIGVATTPGSETPIHDPKPEEPKPFTLQPTMPVEHTITDTQGRVLEGTIVSKSETTISFQTKGTVKPTDIKIAMLSADDQAYIATLVDKNNVRPTVLFLINYDYEKSQIIRDLLTNNGFDVHIGIITAGGYGKKSYNIPEEVAVITIKPIEVIDQFDAIHISGFTDSEIKADGDNNPFSILTRFEKAGKIVIANTGSRMAKKEVYLSKDDYKKAKNVCEGPNAPNERAFTKIDKNFIFYSEGHKDVEETEIERNRKKLLEAIKESIGER